jgi:GNAT superfamily N-acetyltransferase
MKRYSLLGLPIPNVPSGYILRTYRDGHQDAWASLYAAALPEQPDMRNLCGKTFLEIPLWRPDRGHFACADDVPVSCAVAWEDVELWRGRTGQFHWVATHPSHLRRGLAPGAVLAALQCMPRKDHRDAALITQDYRAAAIRLYLQFVFVPHLGAFPDMAARWAKVAPAIREGP